MGYNSDLSKMCYEVRRHRKLSQKQFAGVIGSNQTEVSFIERGFIPSSVVKIEMITQMYKEIQAASNT